MFHQANLRTQGKFFPHCRQQSLTIVIGVATITINGVTSSISIFQAWVETQVQEFVRLVNWPMITLKQADLVTTFLNRRTRDGCNARMNWLRTGNQITGVFLSTDGNVCNAPIPLTLPLGITTDTQGFQTEQYGNDAQTIWVTMSGGPVSFTFNTPIST